MKKANWIITAIIVAASILFLGLWYYLKFDLVDNPLDLALTLGWWVLVLGGCAWIHKSEKKRQEKLRTAYVGQGVLFNPEAGLLNTSMAPSQVDELQKILEGLKYPFSLKEFPNTRALSLDYIVRTTKFKPEAQNGARPEWEGEVAFVHHPEKAPVPFRSKRELSRILGAMPTAA